MTMPMDEAMPAGARKRLQEAAKAPEVVAVWRHREPSCRRVVAVAAMAGEWPTVQTYLDRRVMLGPDREGGTLSVGDGPVRIVSTMKPLPVTVRCCGPVWTLDWPEVWRVADGARLAGRVERVDATQATG